MRIEDILKKWIEYTDFDPDRKKFNLLSAEYEFHKISKKMTAISQFDPSGTLAVLYAKNKFEQFTEHAKVPLRTILEEPDSLRESSEMWDMLHSAEVRGSEDSIVKELAKIRETGVESGYVLLQPAGKPDESAQDEGSMLALEREALSDSVNVVVEEATVLRTELYLKGNRPIGTVTTFCHRLLVFSSIAECILSLERSNDGIYLCYIDCNGSSDSHFCFMLHSNGNLLAITERIPEAYPGQHCNTRNGRWQGEYKTRLFPYRLITSSDYDYKGYPVDKKIENCRSIDILQLPVQEHMPLLLAMIIFARKYAGVSTNAMPLIITDSLLPCNLSLQEGDSTALAMVQTSAIAKATSEYRPIWKTEDILRGEEYSEKLGHAYDSKLFVELYGQGFVLNDSALLTRADNTACEFAADQRTMNLLAYQQGRQQLADYIREKMYQEYLAAGGVDNVRTWYADAIAQRKHRLFADCLKKWDAVEHGQNGGLSFLSIKQAVAGKGNVEYGYSRTYPFNKENGQKKLCPITGATASIFFMFRPESSDDIIEMLGTSDIPKILKGWRAAGHNGYGNELLNITDPMGRVGTPFEQDETRRNQRYWTKSKWENWLWTERDTAKYATDEEKELALKARETASTASPSSITFNVCIGFSKTGLKQMLRK